MKLKLGLVAGLIGPAIITAQDDEVQYVERNLFTSRLDNGGRVKKVTENKEGIILRSSGSAWKSPTKSSTNSWTSPPAKPPSPTWWSNTKSSKSAYDDNLFLAPFSCPRKCVEYLQNSTLPVKDCRGDQMNQQWRVSYNHQFMKFQTFYESNWCIGVGNSCAANVALNMVPCDNDQHADWYFTGGQFLSGYCWARGFSVVMALQSGCNGPVMTGSTDNSTLPSTTFMLVGKEFIESIPKPTPSPTTSPPTNPT